MAQQKLIEWIEAKEPEMVLTDLPPFNQKRIEDISELLEGLEARGGVLKNRDMSSLPYTTGDIDARQDSGSDDENPMSVFDDQKKVAARQKQDNE